MKKNRPGGTWDVDQRDFPKDDVLPRQMRFILRYAILAPSSHNTQPWKFAVGDDRIDLYADESRWLKVADADKRELFISVGCALENLLVAAEHFNLGYSVDYAPQTANELHAATVTFSANGARSSFRPAVLFDAITVRHTHHGSYQGRPIPEETLSECQSLCVEDRLRLDLSDDEETKRKVDDVVVHGDTLVFANPAFRDELAYWIGQGVFGTSWLMSKLGQLVVRHINMGRSQAKKDSQLLMSSPVFGLISEACIANERRATNGSPAPRAFTCELPKTGCSGVNSGRNNRTSQVKTGQLYERVALLAASLGIWTQPMSQILEVPELKAEVARLIPQREHTPLHPFRMGYAEREKKHTPRRPLEEVTEFGELADRSVIVTVP
jgi:nitroreductase